MKNVLYNKKWQWAYLKLLEGTLRDANEVLMKIPHMGKSHQDLPPWRWQGYSATPMESKQKATYGMETEVN